MSKLELPERAVAELSDEAIREQLELLVESQVFRSSKRSVQFLRYVVEQTLQGSTDQVKERTIGVEVFGREPSYDTAADHIVRTAAIELRKRLAIYYGEEKHRSELRMTLVPGSYIPKFMLPTEPEALADHAALSYPISLPDSPSGFPAETPYHDSRPVNVALNAHRRPLFWLAVAGLVVLAVAGYRWLHPHSAQEMFWKPVLDTPGSVLLAVGDVPNGPPKSSPEEGDPDVALPIVQKPSAASVPFADTVTIARVVGVLESHGKKVIIRQETSSSFSDLREGPVVLIGAFNNEWSLRLTRQLRYSLALDPEKHLVYIRDAKNPGSRSWSWATDKPVGKVGTAGGPVLQDYALISRIWNSETGHVVIVIGGLYTYGTEAAGEFLNDPQLMQAITNAAPLDDARRNLQIVLGTTVTDDTAGPPRVLAVSSQ
jgi:hypothetical protein